MQKTIAGAMLAVFASGATLGSAQAANLGIQGAYILADGTVGAGKGVASVLNGVQYQVSFPGTNASKTNCIPNVTANVGQFAVGSARIINGRPITVNVILMDGSGNAITGPDFYLQVTCAD